MNKKSNIVWGIIFVLAAVMIVAKFMGFLGGLNIFGLVISALLVPIIVINLVHVDFAGTLFPLAIIGIIFAKPLGIENLSPWPLLFIALFLSIGLSFLFPHRSRRKNFRPQEEFIESVIDDADETDIDINTHFSGIVRYINSTNLKNINIDCSFGGIKLYLDRADIDGDTAEIDFNLNFSGVELYVPKKWIVEDNVNCILGGVEIKGRENNVAEKTITLKGKASFAGITVIYI